MEKNKRMIGDTVFFADLVSENENVTVENVVDEYINWLTSSVAGIAMIQNGSYKNGGLGAFKKEFDGTVKLEYTYDEWLDFVNGMKNAFLYGDDYIEHIG